MEHGERLRTPLLGACPRIGIFSQIEVFLKNKHSHVGDIEVYAYLRVLFL